MLGTMFLALMLSQIPAGEEKAVETPQAPALTPQQQRQAELRKLIEQRRQRHARGMAARQNALGRMQAANEGAQAQAAQVQAQAAQAQALQQIADAERRRTAIAESQYRLNSQVSGAPQIFIPGEGMVPYANGIAPPWWWGLRQALPQGAPGGTTAPPTTRNPAASPIVPVPAPFLDITP